MQWDSQGNEINMLNDLRFRIKNKMQNKSNVVLTLFDCFMWILIVHRGFENNTTYSLFLHLAKMSFYELIWIANFGEQWAHTPSLNIATFQVLVLQASSKNAEKYWDRVETFLL